MKLAEVETHLHINAKRTREVFPEETRAIEYGLALLWELTRIANESVNDFENKPNLYSNLNLFGRNRQLLWNAYFCMLGSSYGSQFVILRTVLENNNLMRLFNKNPKYAFDWLPRNKQAKFSERIQSKYSGPEHEKQFDPTPVLNELFSETKQKKVREDNQRIYGQLCNYTHPNFWGWHELMGDQGEKELLLELPKFVPENAESSIGITLFLIQLSFKTFVETFRAYTVGVTDLLKNWVDTYNKLIIRYQT